MTWISKMSKSVKDHWQSFSVISRNIVMKVVHKNKSKNDTSSFEPYKRMACLKTNNCASRDYFLIVRRFLHVEIFCVVILWCEHFLACHESSDDPLISCIICISRLVLIHYVMLRTLLLVCLPSKSKDSLMAIASSCREQKESLILLLLHQAFGAFWLRVYKALKYVYY